MPEPNSPLLYFLPSSSQKSLLHLPLLIHEKSHAIYRHTRHYEEFRWLAEEFQEELGLFLIPFRQNNSERAQKEHMAAQQIVNVWFVWLEELFCDMMGLHTAGPAYLYALSHYLRFGKGTKAFHIPKENLQTSKHPVSWIRIRVLANEARKLGLEKEADRIEQEWVQHAKILGIKEDFYGYYNTTYVHSLSRTLSCMIEEAGPLSFQEIDLNIQKYDPQEHDYIQLMNLAWQKSLSNIPDYEKWEKQIITILLEDGNEEPNSKLEVA